MAPSSNRGATGNMRVVQRLLGHARLQTCQHYVEATPADLAAAVAAIVPEGGCSVCA